MATLPIKIPVGMVSIYNVGASSQELFSEKSNEFIWFGVVEQMYNQFGGTTIGATVMFDVRESTPIFYIDQNYYLVPENKIGFTENPPIP